MSNAKTTHSLRGLMGGIAGVFARRGGPVQRANVERMGCHLEDIGPDGAMMAIAESVGMVYRPFYTDQAGRAVGQPVRLSDGSIVIFDGRLDNESAVRQRLGHCIPRDASIPTLVAMSYAHWGVRAFAGLVGEFSFAGWNPAKRELVLCVDSLGRKVLYYHVDQDYLYWCSKSLPLVDVVPLSGEIDEDYVAAYLTNHIPVASPFRGVERLPGGHALIATPDRVDTRRFWSLDPSVEIRYPSDEEYEQHFEDLFRQAVACRLRADGPVWCELSGGLDSSSVAGMAASLVGRGDDVAPELRTISYVFTTSRRSDESEYIRVVEQHLGKPGIHVDEPECPLLTALPDSLVTDYPTPAVLFLSRWDRVALEMRNTESRVLLSGLGGDQVFCSEPEPGFGLADDLVEWQFRRLRRRCTEWAEATSQPYLAVLWKGACRPLLPSRLRAAMGAAGTSHDEAAGPWLDQGFVRRTRFNERLLGGPDDGGFTRPSSKYLYGHIQRTMRPYLDVCFSDGYYETRYPFLDRRLIEFAMAIPLDQKVRPRESRSIVRRSLHGYVPPEILQRTTKAGPGEALLRALHREWPRIAALFCQPRVAELGIVDSGRLQSALQLARHGFMKFESQLFRIISLEVWLRILEKQKLQRGRFVAV